MRTLLAVAAVLLVAAGGLAFATGFGPASVATESDAGAFPTETPRADGSDTGESATATGSGSGTADQPFALTIDRIVDCGTTCRDVTVSLTNQQADAATDVTVYTRVFAGNSTAESDRVWRGSEPVGTLEAGATHTTTRRVELSYSEAFAIQQADGWVTIQTTIETADRTITFTSHRDVN